MLARGLGWRSSDCRISFQEAVGTHWESTTCSLPLGPQGGWLMKNPLLELRSSIASYSSFTCSPLFSMWLFLTTSGSSQPHSLPFPYYLWECVESWMSMLVQCRWIWCFTAQLQAIKWLNYVMLFCIPVSSFSSILSVCSFRLLLPQSFPAWIILCLCVLYGYRCVRGFVFQVIWGEVWWLVCFGFVLVVLVFLCFSFLFWVSCKDWNWVWESLSKFPYESWDREQISAVMSALHLRE